MNLRSILGFVLINGILILWHEIGHATALMKFKLYPIRIGGGVYITKPVMFTDVTESWKLSRKERQYVNIGGVYFQGILATVMLLIFTVFGLTIEMNIILYSNLLMLANLNIFIKSDGYWFFSDFMGIHNLHKVAIQKLPFFRYRGYKIGVGNTIIIYTYLSIFMVVVVLIGITVGMNAYTSIIVITELSKRGINNYQDIMEILFSTFTDQAHNGKLLHRAFSLFLFNKKGELLLQKRMKDKYHSGGLWSNSCCSHPRPQKDIYDEVKLRALYELGILCDSIEKKFSFIYEVDYNDNSENEYDHVFFGLYDGDVQFNQNEVEDICWIKINELYDDINKNSNNYTYWFIYIMENYKYYFLGIEEIFSNFKEKLQSLIIDELDELDHMPKYIIESIKYCANISGKMLRTYLLCLSYYLINKSENKNLLYLATSIELMQNASLIHDDLIDRAAVRRGKPSVYKKYGQDVAILNGDFLIFKSNEILLKMLQNGEPSSFAIIKQLHNVYLNMCLGQRVEETMLNNLDCSQEDYIRMISLKTATFFSGVCTVGALIAKADERSLKAIENYGYNIGIAYQIYDDIMPYITDNINKDKDSDFHRRLVTLPIIISYQLSDTSTKHIFETWYQKSSNIHKQPSEQCIIMIREAVRYNIHKCIKVMLSYIYLAINSLNIFEDTTEKDILISFAKKLLIKI